MANIIPTAGKQIFSGRMIGSSPSQAEPLNIAVGQGNPTGTRVTAVTTDLDLVGEMVANGAQTARIVGSSSQVTTTNTSDTYQVTGTLTCNLGGGLTINEVGLFDTSTFPGQDTVATLSALSGTGTGSATLTSGSGLPTASSNYQIDSEIITASRSGTTLTISARGVNGSTAAAHSGTPIITVATAGGTGGTGKMVAKADFANVGMAQNDTLAFTLKIQFT